MREIKFRAFNEQMVSMEYFGLGDTVPYYYKDENASATPYDVMQFTGLLDKNGKEIYEGDIVNYTVYDGVDNVKREVKLTERMDYGLLFYLECEVIGNIYENPELLNN